MQGYDHDRHWYIGDYKALEYSKQGIGAYKITITFAEINPNAVNHNVFFW